MIRSLITGFIGDSMLPPWNVSTITDDVVYYQTAENIDPKALAFSTDGTKAYTARDSGVVYQYTLSTAWNLSSIVYDSISADFGAQSSSVTGIKFSIDGTKMYLSNSGSDIIYQYSLSTPWAINTAIYSNKSISVTTYGKDPVGFEFNPDGNTMYCITPASDTIYQYTLGTAWDISTASYSSKSFSVATQDTSPEAMHIYPDGYTLYMLGDGSNNVYQYTLSTQWDIGTATFHSSKAITVGGGGLNDFVFSLDANKLYILSYGPSANEGISQLSIGR